jgi:FkbM family methyltransferase
MNTLLRLKEIFYIFISKNADILQNRVIQGSRFRFLLLQISEIMNYLIGVIFGRVKFITKLIAKNKQNRQKEQFIIKNKTGLFSIQNTNDSIVMSSHYYDMFQKKWVNASKKNIFLDIGANIGHYTILAKQRGFSTIIAFEPDPDTYQILSTNIILNKLKQVRAYNFGLGNVNGKIPFEKDPNNTGGNRFLSKEEKVKKNSPYLKIIKLDDFIKKEKISYSKINFIKIDVEGFEFDILQGMKNTIKKLENGTILMIEIWDRNPKRQETLKFIEKNKFKLIKSYDDNYLFQLEKKII